MTLLLNLYPLRYPQVPHSRSVSVIDDFVKLTTITEVELEIDLRTNIFCASGESDALQYNQLKKNHPLSVSLPSLHAVKLQYKNSDDFFPARPAGAL